ncbi:TPA: ATPase F0F1 [Candidatus Sumerlaeota bacterium]|jgi:F1F0 ATPase subunit 2|nr:ATPase F0F1 [Candidatus Sumerlaeota bacterium]
MAISFFIGLLLGTFFFGGLWWTIQKALTARTPALWFLGSMLVRTAVVLLGFYYAGNGDWQRLAACLVGFVLARFLAMRLTRPQAEVAHAHHS